jgi:hypothetical protein
MLALLGRVLTVGGTCALMCLAAWTIGEVVGGVALTFWLALLGASHTAVVAAMEQWVAAARFLVCQGTVFVAVLRPQWSALAAQRIQEATWALTPPTEGEGPALQVQPQL